MALSSTSMASTIERITAKAKITAGWSCSILTPHGGYRHADNIIAGRSLTRRCGRPMKADSVGSEGVEPIPTTALLHRGGLPTTIQLSHRSELGSGKRAVRKWCSRRWHR